MTDLNSISVTISQAGAFRLRKREAEGVERETFRAYRNHLRYWASDSAHRCPIRVRLCLAKSVIPGFRLFGCRTSRLRGILSY
jgi:hypothetical protein